MTPRESSQQHMREQATASPPLSHLATPSGRETTETGVFRITKLRPSDDTHTIIASSNGRFAEPITLSFENTSRNHARTIDYILSNRGTTALSPRDPVPAVTRLLKALIYAQSHDISTSDLEGGRGFDALARFFDDETRNFSQHEMRKLISLKGLGHGIYHLSFPSQPLLTATLLRMQEHFESPRFRGEFFSHEEFRSWYRTTHDHKEFSYYADWAGFNFPGSIVAPFLDGRFGALTPAEVAIVEPFRGMKGKFYVIGTIETDSLSTLRHEIAHAFYHNNAEYRREVDEILSTVDCSPIHKLLEDLGYHRAQWQDETHAYLGDPFSDLECHAIDTKPFTRVHHDLLRVYRRFAANLHNLS